VRDDVVAEGGQQRLVGGGIRGPQVVHRLDEADAEEVGPHPVDDRAGEVGVLRRRQPGGQREPTVGGVGRIERRGVERGGWLRAAGPGLEQVPLWLDVERAAAVAAAGVAPPALGPHPREAIREGVVLVVGPLLERMVVALRTIDRQPEKRLGDVLGDRLRVLVDGKKISRPVLKARAAGRHQFPHERVPREVGRHAVANPAVVGIDRLRPQFLTIHKQNVAPFIGPVVDKLGPGQEQGDESLLLLRRRVSEVPIHLFGRWQTADRVEKRPSHECRIVAPRRRSQPQLAELGQVELIDQVCPRGRRIDRLRHLIRKRHHHPCHGDLR